MHDESDVASLVTALLKPPEKKCRPPPTLQYILTWLTWFRDPVPESMVTAIMSRIKSIEELPALESVDGVPNQVLEMMKACLREDYYIQ